ncbi:DsbA family protein [Aeromonas media]|uniref:DsbA family protein n=1 Tax=Aeromonas TaxID=642 RepID=UPI0022E655CC|nr:MULTISPECIES: DsbA family protein [Aeromonas]WED82925.1 DsbA family protein [Aeromonas media]
MTLSIEVYFDFICPWCLIGKRQLDQALAQLRVAQPEVQVAVSWRGVQLLPALLVQGEAFHDFYLRRLGSEQGMSLRQAQVRQAAASVGVELDFGKIPRMPNTADAHRLWQRACQLGSPSQCEALLESLFASHFLHGGDLGDGSTLLGLAEAVGFSSAELVSSLQGDGTPFLGTAEGAASQGVPSFVLGGRVLSGAQPVERLLTSLRQAVVAAARTSATRIAVPAERVPAPGKRILIEAEGKSLVLFNVDGRFHAIDDGCPHQGASLCGGRLEGEVIQCCAHGLRFNLNTGYLLGSTQLRVNRYLVEWAGDQLHIVIPLEDAASCTR